MARRPIVGLRPDPSLASLTFRGRRDRCKRQRLPPAHSPAHAWSSMRRACLVQQLLTERVLAPLRTCDTSVTVSATNTHRLLPGHSAQARSAPSTVEGPHARGRQRAVQRRRHAEFPGRLPAAATWSSRRGPRLERPEARLAARIQAGLCWLLLSPRPATAWCGKTAAPEASAPSPALRPTRTAPQS